MKIYEITIQIFEKEEKNLSEAGLYRIIDRAESIDFEDIIRNRLCVDDNESIEIRAKV